MVKSVLQYLWVLHSPNLHQLFILTWSTDTMWWFVSLTYILRLSDHGKEGMVKSILQYLLVPHSSNLHQLLIMTWSIDVTWLNVKIYPKSQNCLFLAVTMATYIHSNQDLCFVSLCIQVYSWMRFTKIHAHIWKSKTFTKNFPIHCSLYTLVQPQFITFMP